LTVILAAKVSVERENQAFEL